MSVRPLIEAFGLMAAMILIHLQQVNSQAVTDSPTVESVTTTANETEEGSCDQPDSSRPAPITINTYGGCGGCGGVGGGPIGQTDLSGLENQVQQLSQRVTQLELIVNQLAVGGVGGGTSGGLGGGNDGQGPFIGQRFRDCEDILLNGTTTNGVYDIWPLGAPRPIKALCELSSGRAITVIQAREDGTVDFQRSWGEYKKGFGFLEQGRSFWWGLDPMFYLTNQRIQYRLMVEIRDFDAGQRRAEYNFFHVGPETDRYRLKIYFYDEVLSTAGDALSNYHNYLPFSTVDQDNDYAAQNCAYEHSGGWWYRDCDNANLNGLFYDQPTSVGTRENGIEWDTWRQQYSLRGTKMSLVRAFPQDDFDNC